MARHIDFSDAATWYVPDIEGNRQDPDPFAVLLTPMSGAEATAFERSASILKQTPAAAEAAILARVQALEESVVKARVIEVRGYSVSNVITGEVLRPTDGASLVAAVVSASATERSVLRDISNAILDRSRLSEGARKNLPWLSGSSPAETATPGAGDAGKQAGQG